MVDIGVPKVLDFGSKTKTERGERQRWWVQGDGLVCLEDSDG